jgi:hypothetical protein
MAAVAPTQAIKSLLIIGALYGVLWWLGLLPGQQDPALLQQRLEQMAAERSKK